MSDFTYQAPDNEKYLRVLLKLLESKWELGLAHILKDSRCVIDSSGSFSRNRWNAMYTTIYFYVPYDTDIDIDESSKQDLIKYCDAVMPKNIGFDVMNVEISTDIESEFQNEKTLEDDIEELSNAVEANENFVIPKDILAKGNEMMKVYMYLYAVENFIRFFIEQIGTNAYGEEYISRLNVVKSVKDTIKTRKEAEDKNKWISVRGNSDLFYLDFIDLSAIILNNWDLFKKYFPDQSWISTKLDELYIIRNLVAHNSYVGDHERDVLKVNFRSIIKQLQTSLKR